MQLSFGSYKLEWRSALLISLIPTLIFATFLWLISDIFYQGAFDINWEFLATSTQDAGRSGGIAPIIISTALIILTSLLVSLPIGIGTAIILAEFTARQSLLGKLIRRNMDILAGVPSIVFGLFGSVLFCQILGFGFSILSGGLTLACMILPIFTRTVEDAFSSVPNEHRLSAEALGFRKISTIFQILLPLAIPGIVTGLILGVGRAMAETAALIFTSGYVDRYPESLFDSGRSLSIHIYDLSMNVMGGDKNAYKSAFVLLVLVLLINQAAVAVSKCFLRRRTFTS
ncbi:MAG: phosphate ABC transporter permease PstA [Bdellovibrionota bacterium]